MQQGKRKEEVKIQYVNEEGIGFIVLSSKKTSKVLYSKEINKTEAHEKMSTVLRKLRDFDF